MAKTTFVRKPATKLEEEEFQAEVEEPEDSTTLLSDNAGNVPLFADSDGRSMRSIAYLKLNKLEEKGWAYKGQIPIASTNETIGQQFGDGVYTIEGCNQRHKTLLTKENIRISLGYDTPQEKSFVAPVLNNTAEMDRIERLATASAAESREFSKAYTSMVSTMTESTLARESKLMESVMKTQSDFMAAMLMMQITGHQQNMALMQAGYQQNIAQLKATTGDGKTPTIKDMMELFMQGITVAQQLGGGDDEEDEELPLWQEILGGGVNILASLANNKSLVANTTGAPAPAPTPAEPPKIRSSVQAARDVKKRKILEESLRLRALVRSSGLTMDEIVRRLKAESPPPRVPEPPPDSDEDEEEEDSGDDESDENDHDDSSDSFAVEESEGARRAD